MIRPLFKPLNEVNVLLFHRVCGLILLTAVWVYTLTALPSEQFIVRAEGRNSVMSIISDSISNVIL